jgi:hypothetical protein
MMGIARMRVCTELWLALGSLTLGAPARANFLVEHSFQAKMAEADLVIVGIVTAMHPGHPRQGDATAAVRIIAMLKGDPQSEIVVRTRSIIVEEDPQCCQDGATYVMFLQRVRNESALVSVNGRFGMIRIGPARNDPEVTVIPVR